MMNSLVLVRTLLLYLVLPTTFAWADMSMSYDQDDDCSPQTDCPPEVLAALGNSDQSALCLLDASLLSCMDGCLPGGLLEAHCACETGSIFVSYSYDFTGETYCCGDADCQAAVVNYFTLILADGYSSEVEMYLDSTCSGVSCGPEPSATPSHVPSDIPSAKPTFPPQPQPTSAPTVTSAPTLLPTASDTFQLDVSFGLTGDDACALAANNADSIKDEIAASMPVGSGGTPLTADDIKEYTVVGCSRRQKRRSLLADVAITVVFQASASAVGYQSATSFYDDTVTTLAQAQATLTTALATSCGCTVTVASVAVSVATRIVAVETTPYRSPTPAVVTGPFYGGADCPNGCSGHGSCSGNGCVCHANWGNGDFTGGACDARICPLEIAWVDTPRAKNKAHALRECSGRGVCDRESGDCLCFPGYTGKGCRRTTCPNGCSGHGTCEYLSELRNDVGDAFKWTGNAPTRSQYDFEFALLWDAHKTRGCVCDPKYAGFDCSIRMCPRGDFGHYYALRKRAETQAVVITNAFTPGTDGAALAGMGYKVKTGNGTYENGEFALTFRSTLNEEFTTVAMNLYNLTEAVVEAAINSLPNKVIEASVVLFRNLSKYNHTVYNSHQNPGTVGYKLHSDKPYPFDPIFNFTWYDTDLVILVTFDGAMTSGDQYAMECRTAYCGSGCQPKLKHPLDFKVGSECYVVNNFEPAVAVNWECSGRGECREDGVCECYEGYTDEFCSTRSAIS